MKLEFSQQIFKKYSDIKFHKNPSSGSRAVPRRQTDIMKLIVTFHNFANAPDKTARTGNLYKNLDMHHRNDKLPCHQSKHI